MPQNPLLHESLSFGNMREAKPAFSEGYIVDGREGAIVFAQL